MNIDIIKVNDPAYRLYRDILEGHGLTQHATQPLKEQSRNFRSHYHKYPI